MSRLPLLDSLEALHRPAAAFPPPPPTLGRAVWRMLRIWVPLALANTGLTVWRTLVAYQAVRQGVVPDWLGAWLGLDPEDLSAWVHTLPPPPSFGHLWPWLLVGVPVLVAGTWLHHAVWDHTGLWLLGGLKERRGFRASLVAEAEALRVAALGTLVGLVGFLPVVGTLLALPLLLLDAYLWVFRGFALAARHGCERWRGIGATVVHAMLLGGCALGVLSVLVYLLRIAP